MKYVLSRGDLEPWPGVSRFALYLMLKYFLVEFESATAAGGTSSRATTQSESLQRQAGRNVRADAARPGSQASQTMRVITFVFVSVSKFNILHL